MKYLFKDLLILLCFVPIITMVIVALAFPIYWGVLKHEWDLVIGLYGMMGTVSLMFLGLHLIEGKK